MLDNGLNNVIKTCSSLPSKSKKPLRLSIQKILKKNEIRKIVTHIMFLKCNFTYPSKDPSRLDQFFFQNYKFPSNFKGIIISVNNCGCI